MSDPHKHLESFLYHSEPLEVPYSPNQFLGWDFFCRFLQKTGSSYQSKQNVNDKTYVTYLRQFTNMIKICFMVWYCKLIIQMNCNFVFVSSQDCANVSVMKYLFVSVNILIYQATQTVYFVTAYPEKRDASKQANGVWKFFGIKL